MANASEAITTGFFLSPTISQPVRGEKTIWKIHSSFRHLAWRPVIRLAMPHFLSFLHLMKLRSTSLLFLVGILGSLGSLVGCQKERETVRPASPAAQSGYADQKRWDDFTQRVAKGEVQDPAGQYVSNTTVVADDHTGRRPSRPKVDVRLRQVEHGFALPTGVKAPGSIRTASKYPAPGDPPCDCTDPASSCYGQCGGGPPPIPRFVSTENVAPYGGADNPQGYIWDVKLSVDPNSGPDPNHRYHIHHEAYTGNYQPGYTRIPADLNEGVGGFRMYLTFTRDPSKAVKAFYVGAYASAVTGIDTYSKCCFGSDFPPIPTGYDYIWSENDFDAYYATSRGAEIDLNSDAGGDYVYAYQSKDPAQGTPIEIGILTGDYSNIQPPTGWTKIPRDLNAGAGGKFIYFCYKHR